MNSPATFRKGFSDALPIFFGYLAVGFTLGVSALAKGQPYWSPILLAVIQVSGTGQGAITNGVSVSGTAFVGCGAAAVACLALNLRYVLLSLALAQKLPTGTSLAKRLTAAMAVTDEIVALSVSRPFAPTIRYLAGVFLCSWAGWVLGATLGVVGASFVPVKVLAPLGIAIYGMFIAIVTPMAKASRPISICVMLAVGLNLLFHYVFPEAIRPSGHNAMLLSGIAAAAFGAWRWPHRVEKEDAA